MSGVSARPVVSRSSPPSRNGVGSASSLTCTQEIARSTGAARVRSVSPSDAVPSRVATVTGTGRTSRRSGHPDAPGVPIRTVPVETYATDPGREDLPRRGRPAPPSRGGAARGAAAVTSAVGSVLPVYVERAAGGVVVDVDGNSFIDLGSGIAVTSVGNAAPEVVAAVQAQVAAFTHTCFMVGPYEGYVAVCEELARITPGDHEKRSALFNSGAEAVENAVKIARHATGRPAVGGFPAAYHGRTNLTMALTAKNMPYKHGFGPFAGEVYRVPMSYPYRDQPGTTGARAAPRELSIIGGRGGAGTVPPDPAEPIQGEGGFVVPAPGFLP